MTFRSFVFVILASLIAFASPASAKTKEKKTPKKQTTRTWKTVVDYVLKNGGDDSIHASAAKALGYDSEEVPAKSLGLDPEKSKDGRDHSIFVVYEKGAKGDLIPKEIVLGSIRVTGADSEKRLDSYRIRMALNGNVLRGMKASGIVGEVTQESLLPESKELVQLFNRESDFYLKEIELSKLAQ